MTADKASARKDVWVAFTLLSATFFMLIVDFSIVSIALPSMESELHMTAAQGQWIVSTYAIFLAGFLMLTGRCADIFGRFRFFVAGLTIFTLASLVGGLSRSGTMLITMRALQGLGAALVNPAALAIVLSLFPPGPQRSRAIALWGTAGSLGVAAGMLFGGILVQYLGWRAVLWVNVPVAIAIASLVSRYVPRDNGASRGPKLDVTGAILLTAGLVTFVYAIESIPANGIGSPVPWIAFAVTIGLFVAFAAVERRAIEPILPARLFRYPDLLSGATVVMLQPASYAGVMVFASVYVQQVAGYSPLAAGMAFLPEAFFISFVAAPLTMPIARAVGVKVMGIVTGVLMIAGEVILLFIQPHSPYWAILLPATCIGGFGGMLAYQSGMIAGLAHVDDADEGSASAAMSFALQLGIGLGVAVGAAVQDLVSPPLQAGLHAAFWVAIAFGVLMTFAIIIGLRHAAKAELPLRHYVHFGRLVHRAATKA
ncbi:MAG TPA: MFS transporter [Candidatus Baltobacteraceae bacterium]|nr:MFS transporter [Candidatus Baltobacteraceae bacterium]